MKFFKLFVASLLFGVMIAGPAITVATPTPAAACEARLLGIPPWYRGLTEGSGEDCVIQSPEQAGGIEAFITKLALNIIEMGVVIVGYIAVFFILFGGFQFITNGSNPSAVEKARNSILHAVVGLAIALGAIAILNLIFGILG